MIAFEIVTPEKIVFKDEILSVTIPTSDGEITVLPHHAPLCTVLRAGALSVRKGGDESYIAVSSGFVEVQPGSRVVILADTADRAEDITMEAVEAARAEARALL